MRVVVDASIAAAALVRPRGWTATELTRTDVEWWVPEFLFEELERHRSDLAALAGCSNQAFAKRIAGLRRLRTVSEESLLRASDDPLVRRAETVDRKDVPYIAAAIAVRADHLWTRDRALLAAFPGLAVRIVPLVR